MTFNMNSGKILRDSVQIVLLAYFLISNNAYSQENSNANEWRADLDYLISRLEIQHPNIYANVGKAEFNKTAEALKARIPSLSDSQIVFGIHELLALVGDMHTGVAPWQTKDVNVLKNYLLYPVSFYQFTDGIYVKVVSEQYKDIAGCKVLKFGNLPAEETRDKIIKLINGDNYNSRLALSVLYLSAAMALDYCGVPQAKETLTLTLEKANGDVFEHTMKPMPFFEAFQILSSRKGTKLNGVVRLNDSATKPVPAYLSKLDDIYWYKYFPDRKALYVCLQEMTPKSPGDFDRFYDEVLKAFDKNKADKLILDVRNNGGGDHFEMPLLKGVIARPRLDKPDKLFIIIGRITGSASQHFATQFDIYTNATFIGENSGGRPNHYGAQRFFNLPNSKLPIRSSVIYHQDATEWDMADCTRPDFYTPLSSENYRNNEDPALEFIFNYDKVKDLKKEFADRLSEEYTKNGYEAMEKAYYSFMHAYEKTGINKGNLINDFLNWLISNKKSSDDYRKFLVLYTKECPDWTESWYSLARSNEIAGNLKSAEEFYRKALEVFPGNTVAQRGLALMLFVKNNK